MDNEGNIVISVPLGFFTKISKVVSKFISKVFKKNNSEPNEEEIPQSTPPPSNLSLSRPAPSPSELPINYPPSPQELEINNPIPRTHLHPIIEKIREQKLGKSVLNLGALTIVALLITGGGKSFTVLVYYVVSGLSIGCAAICNGIALRDTFPQGANVMEQLGIVIVLMSLNGLVASAIPIEFVWVPILCGGLCLLPFVIAILSSHTRKYNTAI